MALATYADLKASVGTWLARADLSSTIPDFVTLAHKQLMRDLRGHLRLQKRDIAFSITGQYTACPTDFLELVSIEINSTPPKPLKFLDNDSIARANSTSGTPMYVALVGATTAGTESFRFSPAPSGTIVATLEYYAAVTFFASDVATNWILTDHPSLYLYGSLLQASAFIQDDPRLGLWKAAYDEALAQVKAEGKRARWGANGMAVRPG